MDLFWILSVVFYVGESGRECADEVANILQKIQVNSEERDMAVRLLKTGGLSVAPSIWFHKHSNISAKPGNRIIHISQGTFI